MQMSTLRGRKPRTARNTFDDRMRVRPSHAAGAVRGAPFCRLVAADAVACNGDGLANKRKRRGEAIGRRATSA
jgi:hypothetical protein